MIILGIETSCDETSASIVRDGKDVLSNIVASSLTFHRKYGGIVPEIAFRMQLESITAVVDEAIRKARIKKSGIDLIAVTNGPGLSGSLLVGISFAKTTSLALGVPLVGVNHLYAHIYSSFLNGKSITLPFIALVVSGGHTSLFLVEAFNRIKILGATQDDACGEAFDKVAKILSLGYPGGPLIERLSGERAGRIRFSCSGTDDTLDFSFSGIKTAVLYYVRKQAKINNTLRRDIAASFQEAAIKALVEKSINACKEKGIMRLVVGGGVIMNNRLRDEFLRATRDEDIKCYFPSKELSMDNAAMVAGLGYQLNKAGYVSDLSLSVDLN